MRPVFLLTDFGLGDHYVGVVRAVLVARQPGLAVVDLTHEVEPGDIWRACFELKCSWSYLPKDAVTVAVVDPGVGGPRRSVAVRLGDRYLVCPDNGLAMSVGKPDVAVELDWQRMGLEEPSPTFHGRDLFAPAAAMLAGEVPIEALGEPVDSGLLVSSPLPEPVVEGSVVRGTVLHIDRFGNVITNLSGDLLASARELRCAWRRISLFVRSYHEAPDGELVACVGSHGFIEICQKEAKAAERLPVGRGGEVDLIMSGSE